MSIPCGSCGASLDCVDVYPPDIYSLEGPKFGFVLECPPGENCSDTDVINMLCCNQIIQISIPNGTSDEDKTALINDGISRCAVANFFCGGGTGLPPDVPPSPPFPPTPPLPPNPPIPPPPPTVLYYSHRVKLSSSCPGGYVFYYVLPAGFFVADTQQKADRLAYNYAAAHVVQYRFCLSAPVMCACSGVPTSFRISISGGKGPFSAAPILGHVPDGMSVEVIGHYVRISGTATTPGRYSFVVNVWDRYGNYVEQRVSLNVIGIGYGVPITLGFTAPNVASTAITEIASSNLKVGDTLHFARVVSGVNTAELGTFTVTALDTPAPGQQTITNVTANPGDVFIAGDVAFWDLDSPLPNMTVGSPYSFQLPAVGGSGAYSWDQLGDFPDGLTMSDSGLITGTPTSGESTTLTVIVSDAACPSTPPTIYWGILDLNTPFPDGLVSAIPLLESEVGPYRNGGYHLKNPGHSNNALGWFVVPSGYAPPLDTTGFKWAPGLSGSPFAVVMNTANYNGVSPPFPPNPTLLNYLNGDMLINGWSHYETLIDFQPYRFYIFSECTIAQGGLTTLDGQLGSDTFTLFVTT